jgi:hypothetical protein
MPAAMHATAAISGCRSLRITRINAGTIVSRSSGNQASK